MINQLQTDLEKIYEEHNIYRSIIIVNDDTEGILIAEMLKSSNHTIKYLYDYNDEINFNEIDERLLIMNIRMYEYFIKQLNMKTSTYNFICFSYYINENKKCDVIKQYCSMTKNNINKTIILEKNI